MRRAANYLEFWLDGRLVHVTETGAAPAKFTNVILAGLGDGPGQAITFTDYREGIGPGPVGEPLPKVTLFTGRSAWQNASAGVQNIDFEGLVPPGQFQPFDTPSGLSIGGATFVGFMPAPQPDWIHGPYYLRIVDSAFAPPIYDWGSGAILHGAPIPRGPLGEGGDHSHIRASLPANVTSVGVDLMSIFEEASPFTMVVATTSGSEVFSVPSSTRPERAFAGFTSSAPILSIDFYATNGFPLLDNFAFGQTLVPPDCSFVLPASRQWIGPGGGLSSFLVETAANCSWSVTTGASWITLVSKAHTGSAQVTFSVERNLGMARSGTVLVGGRPYTVEQGDAPPCEFNISQPRTSFSSPAGEQSVVVSTSAGCGWSVEPQAEWIRIVSGGSGSGNGRVRLAIEPNLHDDRTGTVRIAGQVLTVTQTAGACGAVDVTDLVTISNSGFRYIYPSSYMYAHGIFVSNRSGSPIVGNLQLVMIGLPRPGALQIGGGRITRCFSDEGDYIYHLSIGLNPFQRVSIPLIFWTSGWGRTLSYKPRVILGWPQK